MTKGNWYPDGKGSYAWREDLICDFARWHRFEGRDLQKVGESNILVADLLSEGRSLTVDKKKQYRITVSIQEWKEEA